MLSVSAQQVNELTPVRADLSLNFKIWTSRGRTEFDPECRQLRRRGRSWALPWGTQLLAEPSRTLRSCRAPAPSQESVGSGHGDRASSSSPAAMHSAKHTRALPSPSQREIFLTPTKIDLGNILDLLVDITLLPPRCKRAPKSQPSRGTQQGPNSKRAPGGPTNGAWVFGGSPGALLLRVQRVQEPRGHPCSPGCCSLSARRSLAATWCHHATSAAHGPKQGPHGRICPQKPCPLATGQRKSYRSSIALVVFLSCRTTSFPIKRRDPQLTPARRDAQHLAAPAGLRSLPELWEGAQQPSKRCWDSGSWQIEHKKEEKKV